MGGGIEVKWSGSSIGDRFARTKSLNIGTQEQQHKYEAEASAGEECGHVRV